MGSSKSERETESVFRESKCRTCKSCSKTTTAWPSTSPPALLTQGVPPGIPTLESMAKAYLKETYHKLGNVYLGIPHRLDRPVSGIVLFARSSKAAQRLAEQFQKRQVEKIYWGIVEGTSAEPRLDGKIGFAKSRKNRGR